MDEIEMRRAVLDLGLEDLIPLWEIAQTCGVSGGEVVAGEADRHDRLDALVATLVELLRSYRIRVFAGPWREEDPSEALAGQAEALLRDRRRYSVEAETGEGLDRVYYVNVENLPR
ncbi:MAG: hypothetical protein ACJ72E_10355 [Marmoricola sp.]